MEEYLKIAIIQPTTDNHVAWNKFSPNYPCMDICEAARTWKQINSGLSYVYNMIPSAQPDIIVFPELTVASQYQRLLRKIASTTNSVIIAGLDYQSWHGKIQNRAMVVIPPRWPKESGSPHGNVFTFGKKHFAHQEGEYVGEENWLPCNSFYLLDTGAYGKIGFAICADFYDIERYTIYKGRIQHLIILAFNQDIRSFYFLAESISRLVFCNVVICNTGYYGGSVCFSPYKKDYERYCYKHEGLNLFTSQVVKLPVLELFMAQSGDKQAQKKFKSIPPGYKYMNV